MGEIIWGVSRRVALDAIQQSSEGPRRYRSFLRSVHLRGRHHLHRSGDLRGAAD
jgi:hypothetical protein